MGMGTFQIVEGLVNHHLLEIHHVRPGVPNEWLYDAVYLIVGLLLFVGGFVIRKRTNSPTR